MDLMSMVDNWRKKKNWQSYQDLRTAIDENLSELNCCFNTLLQDCVDVSSMQDNIALLQSLLESEQSANDMKIKDVHFVFLDSVDSGKMMTEVEWQNGTITRAANADGDEFDPVYGFLWCVAKRCFGGQNQLRKMLKQYCGVGYETKIKDVGNMLVQ